MEIAYSTFATCSVCTTRLILKIKRLKRCGVGESDKHRKAFEYLKLKF